MRDIAVQVQNLSKLYHLGQRENYKTLRDVMTNMAKQSLQRVQSLVGRKDRNGVSSRSFWALKDVSFEVNYGDVVGIIGRNGAGKSTLLKILSRITEPTRGRVAGYGRVGSLLEVGTGFHPELTGRENIYLNGAILGMKKAEINRKFEEIVAFSEIERFLDTPVKHYSSGMYVRLAFAVAAHLEPEILVVDEVLAVGDAEFQKKCLGKMSEATQEGRTILFVSHNMMAVESLCNRAIWLNEGQIMAEGQPRQIISQYLQQSFKALTEQLWPNLGKAPGNEQVRLHRVAVRPAQGSFSDPIDVSTPFVLEFDYWNLQHEADLYLSVQLYNQQDIVVFDIGRTSKPMWERWQVPSALFRDTCYVPGNLLNNGMHRIEIVISKDEKPVYTHRDALVFEIHDSVELRGNWYGNWPGIIRPTLEWNSEVIEERPDLT